MHTLPSTTLDLQMKHKKGEENSEQEEEEHTVSVISNLFQGLSRGSRRDRVAAKFVENEFEKCDRLMELYNRYLTKVVAEQVRYPQHTPDLPLKACLSLRHFVFHYDTGNCILRLCVPKTTTCLLLNHTSVMVS